MLNKFILILFLLIGVSAKAHQPEVSTTMLVQNENNVWVLQISASLTAFQKEVRTHFSEYKTPVEFQEMVLEHIKNNLVITFNDNQNITLSKGIVKLGHETKVVYEILGVPSVIKTVSVQNTAYKDIYNNKSALVLLKDGFNKEHFVLNKKNNHRLKLASKDNKFVVVTVNEASFFSPLILAALLMVLGLGFLLKAVISKKIQYEK